MIGILLAAFIYLPPNPTVSPLWGPGPLFNFGHGDEQADTNAVAHVWFGAACTLTGYYLGERIWKDGRKGALVGACACTGLVLARLFLLHAPPSPGPGYPSELRAGLATGVVSIWGTAAVILAF